MHINNFLIAALVPVTALGYTDLWEREWPSGSELMAREAFAEAEAEAYADAYADAYEEVLEGHSYLFARTDAGQKLKELQEQRARQLEALNSDGIRQSQRYYKDAERAAKTAHDNGNTQGANLHVAEVAHWRKLNNQQHAYGDPKAKKQTEEEQKRRKKGHEEQVDNRNNQLKNRLAADKQKEKEAKDAEARKHKSPAEQEKLKAEREARKKAKAEQKATKKAGKA